MMDINMKGKFLKYVMMFMVLTMCVNGVSSCSSEDDDETSPIASRIQGTWKMLIYENEDCDWGEYMVIQGNTMHWNSRQAG